MDAGSFLLRADRCLACPSSSRQSQDKTRCECLGGFVERPGRCEACPEGQTTLPGQQRGLEACVCAASSHRCRSGCCACGPLRTSLAGSEVCHWQPVALPVGLCGLLLLGLCAVFSVLARRKLRSFEQAAERRLEAKVKEGLSTVREIKHPMVVINAVYFLELTWEELKSLHEGVRDLGLLTTLDTQASIKEFHDRGNAIVFFSYQWLSWTDLGANRVQRERMNRALGQYQALSRHPLESPRRQMDLR